MIYLDNGATSFPKMPGMIETMTNCMSNYCGNPGRSGHYMSMKTGEEIYKTRKGLAKLFNIADPGRIVFTSNTTTALNQGIRGILKQGDHVITTAMEHNSVLRPLKALEEQGIGHTIIPCDRAGFVNIRDIKASIKENTKLIVCTHASNVTGTIMPIKEIGQLARRNSILFMVDAAQSAGVLPINVVEMNIDLLAMPGHKGLLGPMGTGVLYVAEDIQLDPLFQGGTGTASKDRKQPKDVPEGLESGTGNAPGIIGLGYSVEKLMQIGVISIRNYEEELTALLDEGLRNMKRVIVYGPEDCSKKAGIVTFNIKEKSCEQVADQLNEYYGIASRGGFHCAGLAHKTIGTWETGAVRLSVGPFNTKKEIKTAIEAVFRITQKL
ncbi:aminotransferase class V-fold PLP-dependent enzyme [Clostridium aminobutyricum]|uniref:cysteine desulfurase n=1 Tax=Clostridium aminobutyricum TaxID=33953 RepID=A0A939IJ71_CLOAM|nr:aminotransferase class V-fold PLP-dependent enzyme [Clostridium aminobutyricum]MBN7773308.1 aminotransferase class V-fold PLP-dependent enzyme [Clostridium aminobutyricum]